MGNIRQKTLSENECNPKFDFLYPSHFGTAAQDRRTHKLRPQPCLEIVLEEVRQPLRPVVTAEHIHATVVGSA